MTDTKNYIANVYLPKWPQMLVWGTPVTPEQAMEIIRRTDTFFTSGYGGNNREFDNRAAAAVGMPYHDYGSTEKTDFHAFWEAQEKWRTDWGTIDTEYVHNSWVSCAFIGGPHGWCHPDGKLHYTNNIGKWPDASEVFDDWAKLAAAFPFVDLDAVLMDREEGEDGPKQVAVVFSIKDGEVTASTTAVPFERFGVTLDQVDQGSFNMAAAVAAIAFGNRGRENRFGLDQMAKWANRD